ncbi:MAG: putative sulfate/molybdate transporter, partial [Methanomicrobiales archaeon]|nr:putative sulfate/molybdate transporter [Methanomicrobiales archaeon]
MVRFLPCEPVRWFDELSGSVANFGIIFPIMVGVSFATDLHLGTMLLLCGVWYILIGVWYGVPLSVEPLKAVGALAIAYELSSVEIVTSGIVIGFVMLLLGVTGGMQYISDLIPKAIVRGIQFALGLILFKTAVLSYAVSDPWFFVGALVLIVLCGVIAKWKGVPDFSALLLIGIACGIAFVLGWMSAGFDAILIQFPPLLHPELFSIPFSAWSAAIIPGLSSQLPLTLTNSVLATTLLVSDLYKRPVSSNALSCSVGLMSISSTILGGFPMCHGAGGVAAHYRFGARTGVSMVIGGMILIILALFVSSDVILHSFSFG